MKVLIACECSNTVAKAFRERGHYVISCDLYPNWEDPTYHKKVDVLTLLDQDWDMMIAFPPCTHLAVSGAKHFELKQKKGLQQKGIDFFLKFTKTNIPKWCIENPIGIMSEIYRKPDQIIQPFYFGDKAQKPTCLWLNGLPKLFHAKEDDLFAQKTHVDKGEFVIVGGKKMPKWYKEAKHSDKAKTSIARSKTFLGIAKAMAEQWG